MIAGAHSVFPTTATRVLSCLVHFLGVSLLAHCVSRRVLIEDFSSLQSLIQIPWVRLCILMVFVDSWLFLCSSGILVFGIGLELNLMVCSTAIYLCIACYATSKVLIYLFLTERVYIVWTPGTVSRFRSPVYVICFTAVSLYGIVAIVFVWGRIHYFRGDGACVVGLKQVSSLTLLTYDLCINIFLTATFLWPLLRSKMLNPRIKTLAIRTLIAAGVALTTSTVNVLVLTLLKGQELGWVCLASCGLDVIFNAFALFWVTSGVHFSPVVMSSTRKSPMFRSDNFRLSDRNTITEPGRVLTSPLKEGHEPEVVTIERSRDRAVSFQVDDGGKDMLNKIVEDGKTDARSTPLSVLKYMFREENGRTVERNLQVTITTETEVMQDAPIENANPRETRQASSKAT